MAGSGREGCSPVQRRHERVRGLAGLQGPCCVRAWAWGSPAAAFGMSGLPVHDQDTMEAWLQTAEQSMPCYRLLAKRRSQGGPAVDLAYRAGREHRCTLLTVSLIEPC